ncbi:TraB domain-containing protein [Cephalotus follicularis]|uniref:TraB domain-containing protein n=1 Tax=Cephalotus follicularis TaxID=3775 RepID=A0A1Q3CM27_CEPFO|nr:TraB domain-containing protein [Cephalotus follicularis]
MIRLTRLVNPITSPESPPFLATISTVKSSITFTINRKFSPLKAHIITNLVTTSDPRNSAPKSSAMDPNPQPGEDFVHIENPKPDDVEALSESVVSVDAEVSDDGAVSYRRKELPEELSRSVMTLTCDSAAEGGTCDVFLVGTAHVSEESCREVKAVINYLKPQVVFLELCSSRVAVLTPQNLKVPTIREMVDMWKKKHNMFGILYSWFLAKVAHKLDVFPGSEFRVAYEEAMKYGGKVILGDRPVQITLRRTWGKMPLWHKSKLLYSLLFQAFFLPSPEDLSKMLKEMDDVDVLTLVIQKMSKEFPTMMETLVHERDQYMSSTLLRVAGEHNSVVGVVGKGHLQGIKKHWKQPIVVKDLLGIPSQKPALSPIKIMASLGVAAAGVAIISGIYIACKK